MVEIRLWWKGRLNKMMDGLRVVERGKGDAGDGCWWLQREYKVVDVLGVVHGGKGEG